LTASPEQAALALLKACGLLELETPPINVDEIAEESAGLDIQELADLRTLPNIPDELRTVELSGLLLPADLRIWVNASEAARSAGRRRFTIAHELGHWHLHREAKAHARGVFCRASDVGGTAELRTARRIEAEANRFAAALLMPESLVAREAVEWKFNIHVLARRFDVSLPAMQLRLTSLDLLPAYMR
jgi:hypothetical protein